MKKLIWLLLLCLFASCLPAIVKAQYPYRFDTLPANNDYIVLVQLSRVPKNGVYSRCMRMDSLKAWGDRQGWGGGGGSGTVTSIATNNFLQGGTITTSGTIGADTTKLHSFQYYKGQFAPISITGTVTSVSGTSNRISSTGGTTPVIDIDATYVGQSSITTLGTIGTGTWQGTSVTPTYGGTGTNNSSSTGVAQWSSGTYSVSATLANGTSATTQATTDSTGQVATDRFVKQISAGDHLSWLPFESSAVTQGTFGINTLNAQWGGFFWLNSSGVQNDQIDYKIGCSGGTYTIWMMTITFTNRGIVTVLIDGSSVGTMDCYSSGSAQPNIYKTLTGISISAGIHTISYKTATKNASSSGYFESFSNLGLFRTQ